MDAVANLAELIAPMPVAVFREQLRRREPMALHTAWDVAALLDWDGFFEAILDEAYPAEHLRLTQYREAVPQFMYRKDGRPRRDAVARIMTAGASIVAYDLDHFVPALGRLCSAIQAETGERVIGGAIASTGTHGALSLHYDPCDILVIQIEGSKRWVIQADPVIDPVPGCPATLGGPTISTVIDTVLKSGDMLLVPAGYRHRCEMAGAQSLHVGIRFFPLTAARVVELLLRDLLDEPDARRPLRGEPAADGEAQAALKAMLVARVAAMTLQGLRAAHTAKDLLRGAV